MQKIITYIILVILIIGGIYTGVLYFNNKLTSKDEEFTSITLSKERLVIVPEQLETALNNLVTIPIGTPAPDFTTQDITGQDFRLKDLFGKKILLHLNFTVSENCESCLEYFPLVRDWATKYSDDLAVVILYRHSVPLEVKKIFENTNVKLIPNAEIYGFLYSRSLDVRTYLITSKGNVAHYFFFNPYDWKKIDNMMEYFVSSDTLPDLVVRPDYIKQGQKVPELPVFPELNEGPDFDLSSLKGKPTIVFFMVPECQPCSLLCSLIQKVSDTYKGKVNVLVFTDRLLTSEMNKIAQEYYQKYNLDTPKFFLKSLDNKEYLDKKYFKEQNINVPIYRLMELSFYKWGIAQMPSALLLDSDNRVVKYIPMGRGFGETIINAEDYIFNQISRLLKL